MNFTDKTQKCSGARHQSKPDAYRARALMIVLLGVFALPAAADDANAPTAPSTPVAAHGGANQPGPTERFTFTGIYRFSSRRTPPAEFPPPRLTTGSLPPAPVKPNEPQTGALGGPSPANAAISIPSKSQAPLANSLNPRDLEQSHGNGDPAAAGPLQRISRANIAAASPARLSDPLPELAPAPQKRPVAATDLPIEPMPTATSKPARKKSAKAHPHRRLTKYRAADARPERHPNWWYNAWHSDE